MTSANTTPQPDELLTPAEVAKLLKCSINHLAKGRIYGNADLPPFIRLGKKAIRYRQSSVHDFLDNRPQFGNTTQTA